MQTAQGRSPQRLHEGPKELNNLLNALDCKPGGEFSDQNSKANSSESPLKSCLRLQLSETGATHFVPHIVR